MDNNYTADILFYLALFLGLLLFLLSAITWDNYRDYQYRVMDADKARKSKIFATVLIAFALLSIVLAITLYIMFPPRKIVTKTVIAKPETKNIVVYRAEPPSGIHTMKATQVECIDNKCKPPCPPQTKTKVIVLEEPCCDPQQGGQGNCNDTGAGGVTRIAAGQQGGAGQIQYPNIQLQPQRQIAPPAPQRYQYQGQPQGTDL